MAKSNQFPVLLMQFPTIPDFPPTSDISGPSLHQHSSFLEKSKSVPFDTQPLQFAGESCYVVKQKDRVGRVGIFPCPCPQVPRARQNTMKSVEGADLDISFTTVKNNVHKSIILSVEKDTKGLI